MRTGSSLMRSNSLPVVAGGADGRQQLEQEQLQLQSWDNVRLETSFFLLFFFARSGFCVFFLMVALPLFSVPLLCSTPTFIIRKQILLRNGSIFKNELDILIQ